MKNHFFTSESVTEGHPDKLCDQISDAVLDAYLAADPHARVACEVAAATGLVLVMGEVTAACSVDVQKIVRDTVRRAGYADGRFGFNADSISVLVTLNTQSPDIALGVGRFGAGDQGMMFGYAADETDEYLPMPIYLAHRLTRRLSEVRKNGTLPYLGPDGKSQVTVEYRDGVPVRVDTVVISTQHSPEVVQDTIRADMLEHVIGAVIPAYLLDSGTKYFINPTGRFVVGGPQGDTGLTGRKIIVDTYGGFARHGGGAFSGKDPTKVDRSAAYAGRYIAKLGVPAKQSFVGRGGATKRVSFSALAGNEQSAVCDDEAAGIAQRLEVQVSYAIGVAKPISVSVNTFGTGKLPDSAILELIDRHFDLRPAAIIDSLELRRPIYGQTAAYGHFGRSDLDLPWERLDKVDDLKEDFYAVSGN